MRPPAMIRPSKIIIAGNTITSSAAGASPRWDLLVANPRSDLLASLAARAGGAVMAA
jgi:hypothetical protein